MSNQPDAVLTPLVRRSETVPTGSGTLQKNKNKIHGKFLKTSTTPTSSSASSTSSSTRLFKEAKQGSPTAIPVTIDFLEIDLNPLNKNKQPRQSIDGGAKPTDDEHGGDGDIRGEAHPVPGDLEPMPGVQAPRECLSPRRQVGKVS